MGSNRYDPIEDTESRSRSQRRTKLDRVPTATIQSRILKDSATLPANGGAACSNRYDPIEDTESDIALALGVKSVSSNRYDPIEDTESRAQQLAWVPDESFQPLRSNRGY